MENRDENNILIECCCCNNNENLSECAICGDYVCAICNFISKDGEIICPECNFKYMR